jgi:ribosomal protein S27AE
MKRFNLASIIEAFKNLKRDKGILICPKCGSFEVAASTPFDGAIFPCRYVCLKCGFSNFLFLEVSKNDLKSFAEALP